MSSSGTERAWLKDALDRELSRSGHIDNNPAAARYQRLRRPARYPRRAALVRAAPVLAALTVLLVATTIGSGGGLASGNGTGIEIFAGARTAAPPSSVPGAAGHIGATAPDLETSATSAPGARRLGSAPARPGTQPAVTGTGAGGATAPTPSSSSEDHGRETPEPHPSPELDRAPTREN